MAGAGTAGTGGVGDVGEWDVWGGGYPPPRWLLHSYDCHLTEKAEGQDQMGLSTTVPTGILTSMVVARYLDSRNECSSDKGEIH